MASLLDANRVIPGMVYVKDAPAHPARAPGLPVSTTVYRPLSFAAQREYRDDEDGWQVVSSRRPRRWAGRGKGATN
jgi:hypothetical protein